MKINWKVRWKNKAFWAAVVPAALLLAQAVLQLCGIAWQPEGLSDELLRLVDAAFALLAILGVVADPTTEGWTDSDRAMTYVEPGRPGGNGSAAALGAGGLAAVPGGSASAGADGGTASCGAGPGSLPAAAAAVTSGSATATLAATVALAATTGLCDDTRKEAAP